MNSIPAPIGIRLEGLLAAEVQPGSQLRLGFQGCEQHFFMVAADEDEVAAAREVDELLDAIPRIRPPVDDVAEDDDRVLGLGIDGLDEGLQGGGTAVDVADGEESVGHGVFEILLLVESLIVESVRILIHPLVYPVAAAGRWGIGMTRVQIPSSSFRNAGHEENQRPVDPASIQWGTGMKPRTSATAMRS